MYQTRNYLTEAFDSTEVTGYPISTFANGAAGGCRDAVLYCVKNVLRTAEPEVVSI